MKIFQISSSALLLLLTTVGLASRSSSVSASALENRPSVSTPSAQLISQTPPGMLRLGDGGSAVTVLQQNLSTLGYFGGVATGYFGSVTEDAVKRFQRDAGLLADGMVGAGTDEAIRQKIGSTPAPGSGVLRLNDTGDQVSALQRRLTDLGYFSGPVTGFFGSQTQSAVINFQQANRLTADGMVGASTASAIGRTGETGSPAIRPPSTLLRRGDTGTQVADLQNRLRQLGYFSGPMTGNFGAVTEDAVKVFQRSQGLLDDGIAGPAVNAALARLAP